MPDDTDNKDPESPEIPEGFELITEEEHVRRLGFRLCGDRQQIAEDEEFMRKMRGRGYSSWERG